MRLLVLDFSSPVANMLEFRYWLPILKKRLLPQNRRYNPPQNFMRKDFLSSRQGSAILIALIVLSMITIVTTVFLEKIWSFSQSSNGIEASNRAYYFAEGVIEQQLMDPNVNKYHPWQVAGTGTTAAGTFGTGAYMTVLTGSTIIPATGNGNSPFDSSYNLISLGEPVQLVIPNDITWSNVNLYFRVPQIGSAGTGTDTVYNNS